MNRFVGEGSRMAQAAPYLRLSRILSVAALFFPLLTAIGQIFDVTLLEQGYLFLPPMQPNTAAALVLTSIAVLTTPENPSDRSRAGSAQLFGIVLFLLGSLTLLEYVFGWDLGIDRIFTHANPTDVQPFPGRPSPQTSLNLVLLGVGLFAFNAKAPRINIGQFC